MRSDTLADRLERDDETRTVSAFPDGSVDAFFDVRVDGESLDTREAFAAAIATDQPGVFTLDRESTEPGGHATNVAVQADELGNDVTLAGHLDDPVFDGLPFETVSVGEPGSVSIYGFDDGDVLAVENSSDLEGWTLDDLRTALGEDVDAFLSADAVCCTNWASIDALPEGLASLAETDPAGDWFLVDPGSPMGRSDDHVLALLTALEGLGEGYDVVLAGNPHEVETMAGALDGSSEEPEAAVETLRVETGLAAAVSHGADRAIAATADGLVDRENVDVEPTRKTGGGDRFDAGLVHALTRGWGWAAALALGNTSASYYVATGETGSVADLAAFLRRT